MKIYKISEILENKDIWGPDRHQKWTPASFIETSVDSLIKETLGIEVEKEPQIEYDSINLSKLLENRLKELKIPGDNKIKEGDKILLIDDKQGNLKQNAYEYLKNKQIFDIKKINDKGKLDVGYREIYKREEDNKNVIKTLFFSPRRFKKLDNLDKIAQFILNLKYIEKSKLLDYPVDYLDVDEKGNITFLSRRNYVSGEDPYKSKRRQTTGLGRMLKRVVTEEYSNQLTQKDLEIFINKWTLMFDDSYRVVILEGVDILDAYDCNKISPSWKSSSCANFTSRKDLSRYDVYVENPENIKCLVVYHKGVIHGRRMMYVGEQVMDSGSLKKGTKQILLNYMYGEGGRGSKIDQLMKRWAKDNKAHIIDDGFNEQFIIRINKSCYPYYPPWDSMQVNFKSNLISNRIPKGESGWVGTYGARCPK